ncbi:hypothetical protein DXT91_29465 [Agrobacterium tumefaciens]|uniref:hypothetical protein n=1 Tax=Agrobacterium tumefaciens TaxID=358 RepID=UPI0012B7E6B4|nr:hypothetical protein [Agrobacterium tumefaciens]MQB08166.1 hypothetical protein [Agrobacterium tumefaciens]
MDLVSLLDIIVAIDSDTDIHSKLLEQLTPYLKNAVHSEKIDWHLQITSNAAIPDRKNLLPLTVMLPIPGFSGATVRDDGTTREIFFRESTVSRTGNEIRLNSNNPKFLVDIAKNIITCQLCAPLASRQNELVHAAAVSIGSKAVLLSAPSGSGKTRLQIALLEAGAAFLSGDRVFLAPTATGCQAKGWVWGLTLANPGTAASDAVRRLYNSAASELSNHIPTSAKIRVDRPRIEAIFGPCVAEAPVTLLVFPRFNPTSNRAFSATTISTENAVRELMLAAQSLGNEFDAGWIVDDDIKTIPNSPTLHALFKDVTCCRLEYGKETVKQAVGMIGTMAVKGGGIDQSAR